MRIHSSWNSDRMAACLLGGKPYYIAQYRGNVVSILGVRGGLRHTWALDSKVISAIILNGVLEVETEDGSKMAFDTVTYKMLSFAGSTQKPGSIVLTSSTAA